MKMEERKLENKDYRFGYNTQERRDEIAGTGNHNTAEFWEYSPRVARRWNVDPVIKEFESSYAAFGGNPIIYVDIKGDDWGKKGDTWEFKKYITEENYKGYKYDDYGKDFSIFRENNDGSLEYKINLKSNGRVFNGLDNKEITNSFETKAGTRIKIGDEGNWYDGISNGLRSSSGWINGVMKENWIGNLAGSESSWMGPEGWDNKGLPTMKYTWGTLAAVFTAGGFAIETAAIVHSGIMGTATTHQVGWWSYNGFSLGVGTYNTYVPDNTWGNEIGKAVDIIDFCKYRNPFSIMNYGFRGIDNYESIKKK